MVFVLASFLQNHIRTKVNLSMQRHKNIDKGVKLCYKVFLIEDKTLKPVFLCFRKHTDNLPDCQNWTFNVKRLRSVTAQLAMSTPKC